MCSTSLGRLVAGAGTVIHVAGLIQAPSRAAFRALQNLGFTEAFRSLHPDATGAYSFWDYQAQAWPLDHGIRIDHFLLSPQAADRLVACEIDKGPRGQPKASDHTPVIVELAGVADIPAPPNRRIAHAVAAGASSAASMRAAVTPRLG